MYILLLLVVDIALIYSLVTWNEIRIRTIGGLARVSADYFLLCFALYVIGQTSVLLYETDILVTAFDIAPFCYAVAALLFAIGSYYKLQSLK